METKKLVVGLAAVVVLLAGVTQSQAALIAYDGFNYTASSSLAGQTGGTGVFNGSQYFDRFGNPTATVTSSGLTYGSLVASGNSASNPAAFGETRRTINPTSLGQYDGQSLWFSFLINTTTIGSLNGIELGRNYAVDAQNTGYNGATYFIGATGGTYKVETLFNASGTSVNTGIAPTSGVTDLLVGRIDFALTPADGVTNPTLSLFINPTLGGPDPTTPNVVMNDMNELFGSLDLFGLVGDSTAGVIDEFRLGNTFSDVTPIPEPSIYALFFGGCALLWALRRKLAARS